MKHKTMLGVAAWSIASFFFGCSGDAETPNLEAQSGDVTTVEIQTATVPDLYEAPGALSGEQTAFVSAKVTGYLRELRVQAGERVAASQILGVLDAPELAARLEAAESAAAEATQGVSQAQATREAAKAQADVAAATMERFRSLRDKRAVTPQEFDEVEARHKGAKAGRSAAEAGVARAASALSRAEAEVAAARATFEYTRLRAPFDGRVLERPVDLGNLASPGATLFVLEKVGPLRAEVSVEESMSGHIREGDRAEVVVAHREELLEGTVSEVERRIDVSSRTFRVKVELPADSESDLVAGSFVRVRFTIGDTERLLAPLSAVLHRGQLSMVYVMEDNEPKLRLVTLGEAFGEKVEVLSGLVAGDRVVSEPSQLDAGSPGDAG